MCHIIWHIFYIHTRIIWKLLWSQCKVLNICPINSFINKKKVSIYKVTHILLINSQFYRLRYTNSALTWNIHSSACTGCSSCGRSSKSGGTGSIPRPTGSFYGSHWSSRSHSSFFIASIRTPISGTGRHFPFFFFSSKRLDVAVHTLEFCRTTR